ncbi:TPA: DUF2919 family protein [Salmonella enterica subsp. enterica serovar Saintpaul]
MKTMKAREAAPHIRRPGKVYRAEDYDDEGNLKAPVWLWAVVAWMLLTPRLWTVFGWPEVR